MSLEIFLAMLAAAAMHAGWNAVVKGGGDDPFVSATQLSLFAAGIALCCLPLVAVPLPQTWTWLAASVAIHLVYRFMVIGAYRNGDMAQVYPIMRGAAPMLTAFGALALIEEATSPTGIAGIACLSLGVFVMSLRGDSAIGLNRRAVTFALCAALCTCAYSLTDGIGARGNQSAASYALWLCVGNGIAMQVAGLAVVGRSVYATLPQTALVSFGGGLLMLSSYFIAIWAMTKAPIALVAALRETSVLFGAIIAVVFLKEPLTHWRLLASLLVLTGMVLLRLA